MDLHRIPTGAWLFGSTLVLGLCLVLAAAIFVSPQWTGGWQVSPTPTLSAIELEAVRKGLTWGKIAHLEEFGIDLVGCNDSPGIVPGEGKNRCDVSNGDTSCAMALPILCIDTERLPRPNYPLAEIGGANPIAPYQGWSGGYIGVTAPVRGMDLTSLEAARAFCQAALGEDFRMAEHHDGRYVDGMEADLFYGDTWPPQDQLNAGGWSWYGFGNVPGDTRFWVHINNQPGNCWDS